MPAAAFILATPLGARPRPLRATHRIPAPPAPPARPRRARVQANAETGEKPAEPASPPPPAFEAPSLDTEVFSNFVDSAQARLDDLQTQVQNIDTDELLTGTKEASVGLVDNLLAGDWLNRGELYGAIQLVFVVLLLRGPGALDALVSLICGPLLLFAGAFISGKSLYDLGRKQLSIWPAPVPDAELQTDGMYSYVRHPMYSGLILASAGFAVATGSPARLVLTVAFAAFLAKKVDVEEEFLIDAYPDYPAYCDKVTHKILPGIF